MIRQRNFTSLRPLIFVICLVYLGVTIGTIVATFQLNKASQVRGGAFECSHDSHGSVHCGKLSSSLVIQVMAWIECVLLLPVIVLCMLTLWARAFVERLPGNTAYAIPISLLLIFVLQIIFIIVCLAKAHFDHNWPVQVALVVLSLFALPVAYLFFNLPQINGDSEPPFLRDERHNLLKNASARDKTLGASSPLSSKRAVTAKAPAPTSATATEQPVSGTGTGTASREEEGTVAQSVTGSKEPLTQSAEAIHPPPVAPVSDPSAGVSGQSRKSDLTQTDKSGKPKQPPSEGPQARELEDSESKKKKAKPEAEKSKASSKSGSDRLKHTKIVIPPKSKTRSSRSGA